MSGPEASHGRSKPVGEAPAGAAMPLFHSDRFVLVDPEGGLRGFYPAMDDGSGMQELLADLATLRSELDAG